MALPVVCRIRNARLTEGDKETNRCMRSRFRMIWQTSNIFPKRASRPLMEYQRLTMAPILPMILQRGSLLRETY